MKIDYIKSFVAITVAIVVVAVFAIPVLSDISDQSGDAITKTNTGTGHTFREMVSGDILKCESIYSDSSRTDTWTLNGESVLNVGVTGLTWDWGLISDAYFVQVNSGGNPSVGSTQVIASSPGGSTYYPGADSTYPEYTYSWTMETDGTITFSEMRGDTLLSSSTYSPTWVYVVSTLDDGAYMSAQITTNPYYAKLGNKDVILAGNYTTGDFDTGYYYGKDGVLTILNDSYTGTVNFTQTKSSGTTDIYDTLLTVSVTDGVDTESFSPYRALVPYEVQGHANSGAVYSIMTVLPVMMVLGIVIGTVGLFIKTKTKEE